MTVHNFEEIDHWNNLDDVAALCTALDMVISTKITVPLIAQELEHQPNLLIGNKVHGIIFY